MKNKILTSLVSVFCFSMAGLAQAPTIQWQKCYGGTNSDQAYSIVQTSDGGYISAGQSGSSDGDASNNQGDFDYWIVKSQSNGNIEWQRSLGGSRGDLAKCIRQTNDGGYIVAGFTGSNDGDVIGNHGTNTTDFWIIKLTGSGNVSWKKCYGGSSAEQARSIALTSDGGYIIAGSSSSNDGDVSGNHGQDDCWVIKISAAGDLLWQKCYGGTSGDVATSIQATSNGGYIMCCQSSSNDGDVSGNHGIGDYWIVKLDGVGNLLWQHCFGGSATDGASCIQQTSDGGYIVGGTTSSSDGDVTNNHGLGDFWIVRLNSSGSMIWQRTFGGGDGDGARSVQQTTDGGFVIAGTTNSVDLDITGQHGSSDFWIVKISAAGDLEWQKAMGGSSSEGATDVAYTSDGGFILAGLTGSNNDGDVGANHGGLDCWVVKLAADPLPVKLSQLTAKEEGGAIVCYWQTHEEQNSSHFIVERSSDGIHFKEIGRVTAAGNSNILLNYSFTDKTAFDVYSENLYYRLRMTDLDGSFAYSNIVPVKLKYGTAVNLYPNPVAGELNISFASPQSYNAVIQIRDESGRKVYEEHKMIKSGDNSFSINTAKLIAGTYILTISGKVNYLHKFLKTTK